jgi:hypothetical protein
MLLTWNCWYLSQASTSRDEMGSHQKLSSVIPIFPKIRKYRWDIVKLRYSYFCGSVKARFELEIGYDGVTKHYYNFRSPSNTYVCHRLYNISVALYSRYSDWATGWAVRGSNRGVSGRTFFSSTKYYDHLWFPRIFLCGRYRGSNRGVSGRKFFSSTKYYDHLWFPRIFLSGRYRNFSPRIIRAGDCGVEVYIHFFAY